MVNVPANLVLLAGDVNGASKDILVLDVTAVQVVFLFQVNGFSPVFKGS